MVNVSKPIQAPHDQDLSTELPNPMFIKELTTELN